MFWTWKKGIQRQFGIIPTCRSWIWTQWRPGSLFKPYRNVLHVWGSTGGKCQKDQSKQQHCIDPTTFKQKNSKVDVSYLCDFSISLHYHAIAIARVTTLDLCVKKKLLINNWSNNDLRLMLIPFYQIIIFYNPCWIKNYLLNFTSKLFHVSMYHWDMSWLYFLKYINFYLSKWRIII